MVGGLIMCHGDDAGLRVPPRLAAVQAVVLAVKPEAVEAAARVAGELRAAGVRVRLDDRADIPFGRRAVDWELKGVPVRVELGPRDLAEERATLVRRMPGSKEPVALRGLAEAVRLVLEQDQAALLAAAEQARDKRIVDVESAADVVEAVAGGWARLPWADIGQEGEARLAEHAVSVRCLVRPGGGVPDSEDEPDLVAYCGRAY
jgi:prolyl-tRNA synthetase